MKKRDECIAAASHAKKYQLNALPSVIDLRPAHIKNGRPNVFDPDRAVAKGGHSTIIK